MKTQQSIILIAVTILLVVGAVIALGGSGAVQAVSSEEETSLVEEAAPEVAPRQLTFEPVDVVSDRNAVPKAYIPDGPAPTSGSIYGRLSLATSAIGEFDSYTILVKELVNPNSQLVGRRTFNYRQSFKVDLHRTPRFVIQNIPFSGHGYDVEVFVLDFNGSKRTVQLTAEHPVADTPDHAESIGEEVILSISPGVPFSLRLRDQHYNPIIRRQVEMVPVGDPIGRSIYHGETDGFGSTIFENVIRGHYDVRIGQTILDQVSVFAAGSSDLQAAQILVPVGNDLRIEVSTKIGYGIEDAELVLYAVDTTENRRQEARTDYSGIYVFPHLMPGTYQLDISARGFQRTTRKIRISEEGIQKPVQVRLANR